MRPVVVSIGGSILGDAAARVEPPRELAQCLKGCARSTRLLVTTGGGPLARWFIEDGRARGLPERRLDRIGILVTRWNAQLLLLALGQVANHVAPETVPGAMRLSRRHRIVVMGGTAPGWTTDTVAARLAVAAKASHLVNATSVDGVYDSDPRKNRRARRFDALTYAELARLVGTRHTKAGPNIVFDPRAARIVAQHRIPVHVVDGRDLKSLRAAILGKPFHGTRVGP